MARTAALTTLLLLLSAPSQAKKEKWRCTSLLTIASNADLDASGGLNLVEFTQLWNALSGTPPSDIVDGQQETATSRLVAETFSSILCECHATWGNDEQCCDDTATDDDLSSDGSGGAIWTELSIDKLSARRSLQEEEGTTVDILQDFNIIRKPNWYVEEYRQRFCWHVEDALWEIGVYFNGELPEVAAALVTEAPAVATTEVPEEDAPPATTEATTTEAPATAAVEEEGTTPTDGDILWENDAGGDNFPPSMPTNPSVEDGGEDTADGPPSMPTAPSGEDDPTTIPVTAPPLPISTTAAAATTAVTTDTATTAVTPTTSITAVTTATATEEETTTTEATTTLSQEADDTPQQSIALSFLGSTNGKVNATSIDLDEEATHAFIKVTLGVLTEMKILNWDQENEVRKLMEYAQEAAAYFESVVMDAEDVGCPSGLDYAAEEAPCLQFSYTLTPLADGPLATDSNLAKEFTDNFYKATDEEGALYDALVEEYPETELVGLGSPGKGIPLGSDDNVPTNTADTRGEAIQSVVTQSNATGQSEVQAAGFPVGGIVGIILAASLIALAVIALVVEKRRRAKQRQQEELNDSNLSEDVEANEVNDDAANVEDWLDEEEEEGDNSSGGKGSMLALSGGVKAPGSSLAAMGVASTVATRLSTGDTEVMIVKKQAWSTRDVGDEY